MKYLKVWTSFRGVMEKLTNEEKGRLFDAMLVYAETGEEPETLTGNDAIIWPSARLSIDLTAESNAKRKANGSKGGLAKAENQRLANDSKTYQNVANDSNVMQTIAEKKRKETAWNEKDRNSVGRFAPPTVEEVREYCRERGNNVNPERFIDFYASKGWKVGNQPMKDWKACVRTWEQRDGKKVIAQEFPQRDYSDVDRLMIDELAREVAEAKARDVG